MNNLVRQSTHVFYLAAVVVMFLVQGRFLVII